MQFGYHLTLDLYGCSDTSVSDMSLCYSVLDDLPDKINMHKLSPPFLVKAPENTNSNGKDMGGYSGFVIIAESHISIHTFRGTRFISMDVYSCKEFDVQKVIDFVNNYFRPETIEKHFINRGLNYPG